MFSLKLIIKKEDLLKIDESKKIIGEVVYIYNNIYAEKEIVGYLEQRSSNK
jgi:hypothetical protein